MNVPIKNNVSWVGKVDWELRRFHGDEYSTHRGSSYNSYLVREEKTALIDTVWTPYAEEFVDNLAAEIDLKRIDFIVAHHGESDHSGALPSLLRRIPEVPVYCTANGVKSLRGQYHEDWNFHPVKTGDRLSLGSKELVFVEAHMLHWPDTMFSYLTGDNILLELGKKAGITEQSYKKVHRVFQRTSPKEHRRFLRYLGFTNRDIEILMKKIAK
jgi:flavorubredoxin